MSKEVNPRIEEIRRTKTSSTYNASIGLRDFTVFVEQQPGRLRPPMQVTIYPRRLNDSGTALETDTSMRSVITVNTFTKKGAARKALGTNPTPNRY